MIVCSPGDRSFKLKDPSPLTLPRGAPSIKTSASRVAPSIARDAVRTSDLNDCVLSRRQVIQTEGPLAIDAAPGGAVNQDLGLPRSTLDRQGCRPNYRSE